jgi:hypothetical protein
MGLDRSWMGEPRSPKRLRVLGWFQLATGIVVGPIVVIATGGSAIAGLVIGTGLGVFWSALSFAQARRIEQAT